MRPRSRAFTNDTKTTGTSWMVSFGDLLGILLTFFVMLYSMSMVEGVKWKNISNSLTKKLNPSIVMNALPRDSETALQKSTAGEAGKLQYLYNVLYDKLTSLPELQKLLTLSLLEDKLVISLTESARFQDGKATMEAETRQLLLFLSSVLSIIPNHIDVFSAADSHPINTAEFPSSWELSLSRAMAVSKTLSQGGYPYKIIAFGGSNSLFTNLKQGPSVEDKETRSGRIDIIIRTEEAAH